MIKSTDSCDRCRYNQCSGNKRKNCKQCKMDFGIGCLCDTVEWGTPCPYYEEDRDDIQETK